MEEDMADWVVMQRRTNPRRSPKGPGGSRLTLVDSQPDCILMESFPDEEKGVSRTSCSHTQGDADSKGTLELCQIGWTLSNDLFTMQGAQA